MKSFAFDGVPREYEDYERFGCATGCCVRGGSKEGKAPISRFTETFDTMRRSSDSSTKAEGETKRDDTSLNVDTSSCSLKPFKARYASVIAQWVRDESDLRLLSPATSPPLTREKVIAWKKDSGQQLLLWRARDRSPVGYGELNPMLREPDNQWLGHIIVRPQLRGSGYGRSLVRALIKEAFLNQSAAKLSLIVYPHNKSAVRCYVNAGFAIVGDEYHRYGNDEPRERQLLLEIRTLPPDLDQPL